MPIYFFDTRDNESFIRDEEGQELPDLQTVKDQAALSLAELARDVLPGSIKRTLAVEVRDEQRAVLRVTLIFEAVLLAGT